MHQASTGTLKLAFTKRQCRTRTRGYVQSATTTAETTKVDRKRFPKQFFQNLNRVHLWAYGLQAALHPISDSINDSGVSQSVVYFTAIVGENWSGRCGYTWHLPVVLEVRSFFLGES
ncbi:hypothetical protein TNCV_1710081 [Trichonephila clavipes]|nr:hypothetical protein TNCV_1710081 [Trichonephila clavipes]